jgi:hypothetical protein
MSHKIGITETNTYWVAFNQLIDVVHVGDLEPTQHLSTGQLLLFSALTKQEVIDMIYSEYTEMTDNEINGLDEDGNEVETPIEPIFEFEGTYIKSGTSREILYSEYTDEATANMVVGAVNTLVPGMNIDSVKHKTEDRWLIPFSEYAWDLMTTEEQAPLKTAKESQDGNRHSKSDLTLSEWDI